MGKHIYCCGGKRVFSRDRKPISRWSSMGPQQTLKRPSLSTILRSLFFVTIAASIMISGIIGPLLVHCTPADGCTTIELIGQDPHHHTHSEHFCEFSNSASDPSFSSYVGGCGECVDRFLNHTAILRTASCHPLPVSVWFAFGKLSAEISSRAAPVSDLLPDPALHTAFHFQFKQPLLI